MSSDDESDFPLVEPSEVVKAVKAILTGVLTIPQDIKFTIKGTRVIFMRPTPPLPKDIRKAKSRKLFVEAITVPFEHISCDTDKTRRREKLKAFAYVVRKQWLKVWPVKPVAEGGPVDRAAFIRKEMEMILNEIPLVTAWHIVVNVGARAKGKREPYGPLPIWVDWREMIFERLNASGCHIWPTHELPPRRIVYDLLDEMDRWSFVINVLGKFPSEIPPVPDEPYLKIGSNIQLAVPKK